LQVHQGILGLVGVQFQEESAGLFVPSRLT
jgi:hypothetical protein